MRHRLLQTVLELGLLLLGVVQGLLDQRALGAVNGKPHAQLRHKPILRRQPVSLGQAVAQRGNGHAIGPCHRRGENAADEKPHEGQKLAHDGSCSISNGVTKGSTR